MKKIATLPKFDYGHGEENSCVPRKNVNIKLDSGARYVGEVNDLGERDGKGKLFCPDGSFS